VVSDELGTKRTCPSCAARFYDLNNTPITCPKCHEAFAAEPLLPSKADGPAAKSKAVKPVEVKEDDTELKPDPAVVSLEDLEDDDVDDDADDEAAAIKDVDLGDTDTDDDDSDDSDVFLDDEDEEGGSGVEDLIGGSSKSGSDEV